MTLQISDVDPMGITESLGACNTELTSTGYVYSLSLVALGVVLLVVLFKLWRIRYTSAWLGKLLIFILLLILLTVGSFWFVTNILGGFGTIVDICF